MLSLYLFADFVCDESFVGPYYFFVKYLRLDTTYVVEEYFTR